MPPILIAMSGSFDVIVYDGKDKQKFHLNRSYYGLHLPQCCGAKLTTFHRIRLPGSRVPSRTMKRLLPRVQEYLLAIGGGSMNLPFLDFVAPYEELKAELDEAYFNFMRSAWYILGREVEAFEREFAEYCG